MTLEELRKLADSFFEWPTEDRTHVTLTSALLFAQYVLSMQQQPDQDRLRFQSACEISGDKHPEYVRGYEAAMDAACRARKQQAEPVEYQRRMRPLWDSQVVWTPWEKCTKGTYEDCIRVPVLHDWEHQVRALYTAPQAQPSGNPVGVVREFHVDWRDHKPPEGTELYSYGSLGPSLLEQSDLEFIAARLGRVAKRVGYPMPSGDAQFIVSVSGSILGAIARILDGDTREKQAQPAPIPTAWQPIESAPDDVHVLVHYAKHITDLDAGWAWGDDDLRTFVAKKYDLLWVQSVGFGEEVIFEPTHWQPLPPAPGGDA